MGVISLKLHRSGNLSDDVRTLFYILRARKTKLFVYVFMFAFVACTAYIAFRPTGEGSPWFDEFFVAASASTAAYRSQFTSLIYGFLPNSSSTFLSGEEESQDFGSQNGRVFGKNWTENGHFGNNQTALGIGSSGNDGFVENRTSAQGELKQSHGALPRNQTRKETGSVQSGVSEKSQASQQNGIWGEKQSLPRSSPKRNGDAGKIHTSSQAQTPGSKSVKGEVSVAAKSGGRGESASSLAVVTASKDSSLEGNSISNIPNSSAKDKSSLSSASAEPVSSNGSRKRVWSLETLRNCDIFRGTWVEDGSYPLYPGGSCPHIDESFDCYRNGRPDRSYQKLRWQPSGCNIPRLNATDMLERLRGKRLVFVGDSLNRNMWESLVCILRNSVKHRRVFEASGRREFRTQGSYSFLFKDYGCTVEFFRAPFLVQEWKMPDGNGKKKETLRLDRIEASSSRYKDADVIVFNTGHWWTHYKTSKGKDYYQEGNRIYEKLNVAEAFRKALVTWATWVDANINPRKSLVFFRGYSAAHFRGGQWNSGGQCDSETQPIKNESYLSSYPPKMHVLESVLREMKTPVSYMNITRMTDYRKDGHPSIYRKRTLSKSERKAPHRYQDCSHWCLPGVPDSWNELLYAQLLINQN